MAALVQTFPQQSSTITMLQTRPSSASGMLQNTSQTQGPLSYSNTPSHAHRNSFHGLGSLGQSSYRGQLAAPISSSYDFTSALHAVSGGQNTQGGSQFRAEQPNTSSSAPNTPSLNQEIDVQAAARSRYPATASVSTTSSSSSDSTAATQSSTTASDAVVQSATAPIMEPAMPDLPAAAPQIGASLASVNIVSTKSTPDRYRRPANRRVGSGSPVIGQQSDLAGAEIDASCQKITSGASLAPAPARPFEDSIPKVTTLPGQITDTTSECSEPRVAVDDMQVHRQSTHEQAKRYRRRSIQTIDVSEQSDKIEASIGVASSPQRSQMSEPPHPDIHPLRSSPVIATPPGSSPRASNDSVESLHSSRNPQLPPQVANKRDVSVSMAISHPTPSTLPNNNAVEISAETKAIRLEQPKLVNIPPRASSSDVAKRVNNPSPLSKPMTMSPEPVASKDSFASAVSAALQQKQPSQLQPQQQSSLRQEQQQQQQQQPPPPKPTYAQAAQSALSVSSPAAKQLAALSDKDAKKSKTSRLRRAFSFGSAAELRKAGGEDDAAPNAADKSAERAKIRKERYQDEQEAEQARIAQKQEEGGIGQSIYSSQGRFFSGSTDNLSISSTASSASIMIRKMGKGMKKSGRNLVGIFRPKSVIGVPAADSAVPQAGLAQVSMVTVEAEREKVNVNADPHDQPGGGTSFPKLERNSIDTGIMTLPALDHLGSFGNDIAGTRRSIVGGEKERAEVLAAVKKGILKRSGTDSGTSSPIGRPDGKTYTFNLPTISNSNESPNSTTPSTPTDEAQGHRRTDSVTLNGDDYFMSALRFGSESKSVPGTPQSSMKRNATFSPRIIFHDTWPSGEYDRRGEIATCNRLTPVLAQQIKEELNTFKMEMEVHENSKIYTQFF